jgi:RNA polymerase sigma factor for flagellar operon FliA
MGMPLADLVQLEGRLHRSTVLSLDAPTRDHEGDTTLAAIVLDPAPTRWRSSSVASATATCRTPCRRCRAPAGCVVGYFLEGRTSAELAASFGVTESRVSQMRTEALTLVREGLAAEYGERTTAQTGRAAARQARYNASLSAGSTYASRLSSVRRTASRTPSRIAC